MRALRSAFKQYNAGISNGRDTAEQLTDYALLAWEFIKAGLYVYENEMEAWKFGENVYNEIMNIVSEDKITSSCFNSILGYHCLQAATHQRLPPESWTLWHGSPNDG